MCNCIIGLLRYSYDGYDLATLDRLKEAIRENIEYNEVLIPMYACDQERLKTKIWQLRDYGDFRKSTNLTRFKYCPECGKQIDWKEIRSMKDIERSETY